MKIDRRLFKHIDYSIIFSVLVISLFGIATIGNATSAFSGGSMKTMIFQALWLVISCIIGFFILIIDYNTIGSYYKVFYAISIVLLILVLVIGTDRNGHKSWLGIGQLGIQPTEFAKIVIVIVIAKLLEEMNNVNTLKNLAKVAVYAVVPMVLIQLQHDSGSNIVFFVMIVGMLFVAGLDLKFIFGGISLTAVFIAAIWNLNILKQYQKDRIRVFLNPSLDALGSGYNVLLAKTAVGSGQAFGLGYFTRGLTDGSFIPEDHTDFIFSAFAEKWGFVGSLVLMALYLNIIVRGALIAKGAKDKFGKYMVIGILTMLTFHVLQNAGMNIGIMPVTGIPLPFMSYGGSSLLTNVISVALILNVGIRRKKIIF